MYQTLDQDHDDRDDRSGQTLDEAAQWRDWLLDTGGEQWSPRVTSHLMTEWPGAGDHHAPQHKVSINPGLTGCQSAVIKLPLHPMSITQIQSYNHPFVLFTDIRNQRFRVGRTWPCWWISLLEIWAELWGQSWHCHNIGSWQSCEHGTAGISPGTIHNNRRH